MEHIQALPGWQKSRNRTTALRTPRTWLVSLGTLAVVSLLLAGILAFLSAGAPALFASLFPSRLVLIGMALLVVFCFAFVFALFTNRSHKINVYRKAVKKHLALGMNNYYAPEGALTIQEHLATLQKGKGLREGQERHLLILGGPGSGKTANLKYAIYQAVSAPRSKVGKLPVLIQMKYYNGFLRNVRAASAEPGAGTPPGSETAEAEAPAPKDTLLAYLLDDQREQKPQPGKEPELVGLQHLRHYLPRLVAQGRIVFLCDGMNELENEALAIVHAELTHLMQTTRNSVVMTCRELEYQEQELLKDLANNGAAIKMLPPLTATDVAEIVKMQLQGQRTPGQIPPGEAGIEEAQEQIRRLSQSYRETSPFVLMMLIQALKTPEAQARSISRGRLLRLSVDQRSLTHEPAALIFGDHPDAQQVKDFLSAVACTARRNGQRNAIQLVKDTKFTTSAQLQDFLNVWLSDNEVDVSHFTQANIGKFLRIALDAGLITISNNGVLSFIHELIAEYFAAEYLRFIYHRSDVEDERFWHSIYESEVLAAGLWSEPIAIWAGLEDQPKEIARFLMNNIDAYCQQKGMDADEADFYHYHALALSLGCLGVRASDGLPEETLSYLKRSVLVKEKHEQLALIFKRCADEGGIAVYQALLPYIHLPGLLDVLLKVHELYREKENSTILAMLFEYLEQVATIPTYAEQTQALITLLGEIGRRGEEMVRPRTQLLSALSRPAPLRAAAINILELLGNPEDVALLISYLHTSDQEVIGAAISAVRSFGPEPTLALLEEEEARLQDQTQAQTRLNLLRVLEGFLEVSSPQPSVAAGQMQRLTMLIIRFLSASDQEPTWRLAHRLLNEHIQQGPEEASLVTICLLDVIDTADLTQAAHIQQLLRENCLRVFETITNYWKTRQRRDSAWQRIVLVLGSVSDASVLAFLLQQLDEAQPGMQQALSTALSLQQESVGPLLQVLLAPTVTRDAIQVSGNALRQVGISCIPSICEKLLNMPAYAEATEVGLKCLIELLDAWKQEGRIPAKTEGTVVRALVALFKWLIEDAQMHAPLAADVIPVMAHFRDQRVVSTLVKVLARPGVLLERIYEEAIKGLSQLGDYAVEHLIEALNSPKETVLTKRVRQVLLEIEPFPREKLLAAFADTRPAVVQQVTWVFIANQQEAETVRFLVKCLLENSDDPPLFDNIQRALTEMQPAYTMPYLIEVLGQPHWQVIKPLLRACPQPEIVLPLLLTDPADVERYLLALEVLREEFHYPTVLPWLMSGLANDQTREHTRRLIATMARTYDGDLAPDIVRLFNPAVAQPEPLPVPLPAVQRTLQELLTTELAENSLPALVLGLAEPPLRDGCTDALVALAQAPQRQAAVLQSVLHALRNPAQRPGAHQALVKCGGLAAQPVCDLVRGNDQDLVKEASIILAEIGTAAFPSLYQLAHDPQYRAHAEGIFHLIPVEIVAQGLLTCFASTDREREAIALYMLALGIHDEQNARAGRDARAEGEHGLARRGQAAPSVGGASLTSALLVQALEHADEEVCLRALSALVFFSKGRRSRLAQQMVNALAQASEAQAYRAYLRALALLGPEAADPLGLALSAPHIPENIRLAMIGTLGTLAEDEQVAAYVNMLAAGTGTAVNEHRARGLRALGSLLAGGFYHEKKLEALRENLSASSKGQDRAAFEFFEVLLGKRNLPEILRLREIITRQQGDIDRLNQRILQQEEALAQARQRAEQTEAHAVSSHKLLNRR